MECSFETYVFHSNLDLTNQCINAGIDGVIIDWEEADKRQRQSLYNTQINKHDESTLSQVKSIFSGAIICRVNGGVNLSKDEIKKAIRLGATDIMVPMIKSIEEINYALSVIDNQARCIPMIETNEAVEIAKEIGKLAVDKVFIGLNDLSISRNSDNVFLPLIDGTVDYIRQNIPMALGVAGLTHPNLGNPVPCKLLLNEMKRLKCDFSFLRRSFFKDSLELSPSEIIDAIEVEMMNPEHHSKKLRDEFVSIVKEIDSPLI